jgi:hypothetical protein
MRPIRPTCLAALVAAVALLLSPAAAVADGDPASDILLIQDTFFPYQPPVSPNLAAAVNATVARAKAAGFPLKVAIVAAVTDLGAVPDLFGQPQRYADFLDREISYNKPMKLLVVMPQGLGVANAGPAAALAGQTIPPGTGADRLARAAIPAIVALAVRAGHPITAAPIPAASGSGGGGTSPLLTFGAPLALVLLAGGLLALSRRGSTPDGELGDEEDEREGGDPASVSEPGAEPGEEQAAATKSASVSEPSAPVERAEEAERVSEPRAPDADTGAGP